MFQAAIVPSTAAPERNDRDADLLSFLAGFIGDSIHLVAIGADGRVSGRHFATDAARAASWARRENERGANIYFSVNQVRPGLHTKGRKEHVQAVRFAHLDIDPPKDGSPWNPAAVVEGLFDAAIRPALVLSSGNGLQAFWRVTGATADSIEAVNKTLATAFGGDPGIWNVDRIMRVPGTTNWPNARQRAAGRGSREASVLWIEEDGPINVAALAKAFEGSRS